MVGLMKTHLGIYLALALLVTLPLSCFDVSQKPVSQIAPEPDVPNVITVQEISLSILGSYSAADPTDPTDHWDKGASESIAYDAQSQRLFTSNLFSTATDEHSSVDIISIQDPAQPTLVKRVAVRDFVTTTGYFGNPGKPSINSVAVKNGIVAAAVENYPKWEPGWILFFDTEGNFKNKVIAGALPDMVTFTPDGRKVLAANEGESFGFTADPEGSISIIDISAGVENLTQANVQNAGFQQFNNATLDPQIRIFGVAGIIGSVAQDLEPEYITVSPDSKTAYVTLQENNALALVDIDSATVTELVALGTKDCSLPGTGFDGGDRDAGILINNWPVHALYQPDGIATFEVGGELFLVTANEGDIRGLGEETELRYENLDPVIFPNAAFLKQEDVLGRLDISRVHADPDGDGDLDFLFSYGTRSFSIWNAQGQLVFDSGDDFERITAQISPQGFNTDNTHTATFDSRSTKRGPEPEGVEIGKIGDKIYAFITLERVGGIMVYEVTDPHAAQFVQFANNRNYNAPSLLLSGDSGPETLKFIPASESPNGKNLLAVASEVSGTTTVWEITVTLTEQPAPVGE